MISIFFHNHSVGHQLTLFSHFSYYSRILVLYIRDTVLEQVDMCILC